MDLVRSGRHIVCRWIADKAYVVSITLRSFDLLLGSNTPEQKNILPVFHRRIVSVEFPSVP